MKVALTVNGKRREAENVWDGESLMYVLRERLDLMGSKNACEQGACGSCTVYLDGEVVCACVVPAGQADGCEIITVEGLSPEGELDPIQQAYLESGAVQCGFCIPGLIVATHDLLMRNPRPSELDVREALVGNLCRCTGFVKIVAAVELASSRLAGVAVP